MLLPNGTCKEVIGSNNKTNVKVIEESCLSTSVL